MNQKNKYLKPLAALREKMLTEKDLSAIMNFFFDTCADHPDFMDVGQRTKAELLMEALPQVLAAAGLGPEPAPLSHVMLIAIPEAKFIHGGFQVRGCLATLIYFQDLAWGVVAVVQPLTAETKFVRFNWQLLGTGNIWQ